MLIKKWADTIMSAHFFAGSTTVDPYDYGVSTTVDPYGSGEHLRADYIHYICGRYALPEVVGKTALVGVTCWVSECCWVSEASLE